MERNVMQDVVAGSRPQRKPAAHAAARHFDGSVEEHPFFKKKKDHVRDEPPRDAFLERKTRHQGPPRTTSSKVLWVVGIVVIAAAVFGGLTFFGGATVKVIPKSVKMALDGQFTATKDAEGAGLPFQIMSPDDTESVPVLAGDSQQLVKKASGVITISNDFTTGTQRLVANTRFQAAGGLIYRITAPLTIPGQKVVGGKKVPGTIDAAVAADQPGAQYNKPTGTDLTIPGFSGDPRFTKITAKVKTEIAGGAAGAERTPVQATLDAAVSDLKKKISEKLLASAASQKPDNFELYENAVFIKFDEPAIAPNPSDDKNVTVSVHGTLTAIIFDKDKLSRFIATNVIGGLDPNDKILISNLDDLIFALKDKDTIDPSSISNIGFSLKGNPQIVWVFDEVALKHALAGQPKNSFKQILAQFPSIERAEVVIRPFWKAAFPVDGREIKVETTVQ